MRNMWTKYFYYFQGLRALKCHRTKRSNRINNRSKLPPQTTLSRSAPSHLDFQSLWPPPPPHPPPARISIQNPISRGGVDFFWKNPLNGSQMSKQEWLYKQFTVLFSFFSHIRGRKILFSHSHIQEMARKHTRESLSKLLASSLSLKSGLRTFISEWGHSC